MQTFKAGDKVTCIKYTGDACEVFGLSGVVVHIKGNRVGVAWEGYSDGHTCGNRCQPNCGWYVTDYTLKKLQTFKGNIK